MTEASALRNTPFTSAMILEDIEACGPIPVDAIAELYGLGKRRARTYIGGLVQQKQAVVDYTTGLLDIGPARLARRSVRPPPATPKPSPPAPSISPAPPSSSPEPPSATPPPSSPTRPRATRSDTRPRHRLPMGREEMQLATQNNDLRRLFGKVRREKADAITAAGVHLDVLYDPLVLGELVNFTIAEDERFATEALGRKDAWYKRKGKMIRRRANRFPASFIPAGFSKLETKQRRDLFNLPRKAADAQRRRAADKAAEAARVKQAGDLDCRASALDAVVADQEQTIVEIMGSLASSPAFRTADGKGQLTRGSLKKAIQRTLPELVRSGRMDVRRDRYKNGRPMMLIRRRQ